MFLSDLSIKRPIMMSMFLIVFLLFGALAFLNMPLDLMPKIDVPYVAVQTVYSGAGPKEIETQITKKLEDAVSSVSKIDQLTSYSMEGISIVIIKFEMDKDVDIANQEVKDKVDAIISELPDDAELPTIEKVNLQEFPIIDIVLTGDMPVTELWDIADKQLKDRFSQVEGVARAEVTGGQEREIRVVLNDRAVFQNDISLTQLSQILGVHNLDMPGGHFESKSQEYTVRMTGEFQSVDEVADLEIPTAYGNKRLKDIATVVDAGVEVRERTSFFNNVSKIGNPDVVLLSIIKTSEGNTVDISKGIYKILPEIEQNLPAGCNLEVVTDKSTFIDDTVDDTITNIILGILLTGLVLFIFLHDIRSTIIVALAMPMSILSAFLLMNMMDFTKNVVSLMGLSTAVGILVTNSVIVLENIFRHKQMGKNRKEAAAVGTSEVVVAVLASTATNIAVFLPIANMSGILGQIFESFALTVTFATIFSLLISFTLTPLLASLILPENGHSQKNGKKRNRIAEWYNKMNAKMEKGYQNQLAKILKNKKRSTAVIAVSVAFLIFTLLFAGNIGFEFTPNMDEGDIQIEAELPIGYNLGQTAAAMQMIEDRLKKEPAVKTILTQLGTISRINTGTNMALLKIKLVDIGDRELTTPEMANRFISELSDIPNMQLRVSAVSSMSMGSQAPVSFFLKGQDIDQLEIYKEEILARIKDVPGLINLNTSSRSGKPEISIIPDRRKIADAGLTVYDIAMQIRGALTGLVATQYRDEGEEYDVRVMVDDASLDTPEEVANLTVVGTKGKYTLSQLADIEFSEGVNKILHIDKYKAIEFSGYTSAGVPLGNVTSEIDRRLEDMVLKPGYKTDWGSMAELMNEAIVDMLTALILAIVLTYMLLAAILEDLKQPLLVLGTFPLALIGVIGAMVITGTTMNILAMMAIVMLLGIVVNTAILILDYANVLTRDKGMSVREALLEACPVKLRPIIMAAVAIILGMLPMALGMGASGREFRQPMGIVTIGGLVVSTALTLYVIPALFNMVSKSKKPAAADQISREV
ncbi:MAG: efflux RND transporter permease subunit [candidate division Zixibacteria bacterium]|nr:efflux RND transporter permease subunit [candidate division Zixibacteria bacterium]